MVDLREAKRKLRREIRQRLAAMQEAERIREGRDVSSQLLALPAITAARTVMAYWAMPNELPLEAFVEGCVGLGKRVVLPVVVGEDLELYEYSGLDCLRAVPPFGIMEPHGTGRVRPEEVDVVIVPGVAFDTHGGRLGHGKGYYDRLFPCMPEARLVGVCFGRQLVASVPMEAHDTRMEFVVTAGL